MASSKAVKKMLKILLVALVMLSLFFSILAPVVLAAGSEYSKQDYVDAISVLQKKNAELLKGGITAEEKAQYQENLQSIKDSQAALDKIAQDDLSKASPSEQTAGYSNLLNSKKSEFDSLNSDYQKAQGVLADAQSEYNAAKAEYEAAAKYYGVDPSGNSTSGIPEMAQYEETLSDAQVKLKEKQDAVATLSKEIDQVGAEMKDLSDKVKNVSGSGYDPTLDPKTLIPNTNLDQQKCFNVLYALQISDEHNLEVLTKADLEKLGVPGTQLSATQVLGCAIKTGMVKLWMLPLFIKYIIDFLLSVAGLIAVLFLTVGGYLYMFGGLSSDKERGKNAIIYGIAGFVVALLAWVVINAIQLLVTS